MNVIAARAHSTRARGQFGIESLRDAAPEAVARPIVWSIAGSDSGGGAGLQADLKAMAAFGVHGCTVVAAITAQNSVSVTHVEPVTPELLDAQLAALAHDMPPQAIKTGLLGSVENLRVVCRWVDQLRATAQAQGGTVALVVDPVLGASTGIAFAGDALVQAYVAELLPRATLVTPNQHEAWRLLAAAQLSLDHEAPAGTGAEGIVPATIQRAAQKLSQLASPPLAVAITGGDASPQDSVASDWLTCAQTSGWLSLPRVDTAHHHGTGCTFASTAAAALASAYCVADAVVLAKMATTHALRHSYAAGAGAGPVAAQADYAQHVENLPWFTADSVGSAPVAHPAEALSSVTSRPALPPAFATLRNPSLGVYAVVDSVDWVRRVLAAGIRTVQLRVKDAHDPTLEQQMRESIALAHATPGAQLFINDHWQLALRLGAYGVHLGQEDLDRVDLDALRSAGVRLGLSTHSYWEVARAWGLRPSYIACGPIFATQSKDMPWIPQGLHNLHYWAAVLAGSGAQPTHLSIPVVGIAGINTDNMAQVAAQGVAGAAVITAITRAADPEAACRQLVAEFARGQALHPPNIPARAVPTL